MYETASENLFDGVWERDMFSYLLFIYINKYVPLLKIYMMLLIDGLVLQWNYILLMISFFYIYINIFLPNYNILI
jgi:hypothetical protein